MLKQRVLILAWNSDGDVYAMLAEKKADNLQLLSLKQKHVSLEDVPATLRSLHQGMDLKASDLILATNLGVNAASCDLPLPVLKSEDLNSAVDFALEEEYPGKLSNKLIAYRAVAKDKKHNTQDLRVVLMHKNTWEQDLAICNNIAIDYLLPAFVLADFYSSEPLVIHPKDGEFYCLDKQKGESLRIEALSEDELGSFEPLVYSSTVSMSVEFKKNISGSEHRLNELIILAQYALSPEAHREQASFFPIPKSLRPKRHEGQKKALIFMSVYVLLALGILVYQNFSEQSDLEAYAIAEQERLEREVNRYKQRSLQLTDNVVIYEAVAELGGASSQLEALLEFGEVLPESFLLDSVQIRQGEILAKLKGSESADENQIFKNCRESKFFNPNFDFKKTGKTQSLKLTVAQPEPQSLGVQ